MTVTTPASLYLRELVLHGVQGVAAQWRVPWGNGVTLVQPADERAALLPRVLLQLVYPDRDETSTALSELCLDGSPQSRMWLSVAGRDDAIYSVLADAVTGQRALLREGPTGELLPVANTATDIRRCVTTELGFPPENLMRGLFITRRQDMPSQRNIKGLVVAVDPDVTTLEARRARLAEVRSSIARTQRLEALEVELDALKVQVAELDAALVPVARLRAAVDEAEARLTQFSAIAAIPADFAEQVAAFRGIRAEANATLAKLAQRKRPTVGAVTSDAVLEAFDDPLIRWGGGVGVSALLLALIGGVFVPVLGWAGVLCFPAFGAAALGVFRFVKNFTQSRDTQRKLAAKMSHDEERVKAQLDIDESQFKSMLARAGVTLETVDDTVEKGIPLPGAQRTRTSHDVLDEVVARVQDRSAAQAARERARAELQRAGGGDVDGTRAAIAARARAIDDEIVESGGFIGSTSELEREAAALAQSLGEETGPVVDAAQPLLDLAGALFAKDLAAVVALVNERVPAYVKKLTEGRYTALTFGPQGEVSAVDPAGAAVAFPALPAVDRDLVYLALKLTIVETAVRKTRLPVVLERALDVLPATSAPVLVLLLQFLGSLTQVLVTTSQEALVPAAQDRASLP